MKNKYVGDINDYIKFGILRCLTQQEKLMTTVVWMLTEDDVNSDGKKITYLKKPEKWKKYDKKLYCTLQQIVNNDSSRNVSLIEKNNILPNTQYYNDYIPKNPQMRAKYFNDLQNICAKSDLIFFDPDNGFEVNSVKLTTNKANKYLFWYELRAFLKNEQSVLVYQHFPRVNRQKYLSGIIAKINRLYSDHIVYSFSSMHVVFFLILRKNSIKLYQEGIYKITHRWENIIQVKTYD